MKAVYFKTQSQQNSTNSLNNSEARFFPLIATFQKSSESWQEEKDFLQDNVLKPKVKEFKIFKCSIDLLSSKKTKDRGNTHRFQVSIILRKTKNVISTKESISNILCDFNKPFNLDDGSKLFFKLDTG